MQLDHKRLSELINKLLFFFLPELEEHAAFLLPLRDHLEGVQTAVTPVAVPAAKCDERAVEAVVPGAVFIHIPQTVLVPTDCETTAMKNNEALRNKETNTRDR